ncbi:hypothetical protein BJ1_gp15 [Halorubrum virus BJ1]|uniref:Uncharacterized protein n=1 Tax=Halorubrum virus BJ1 TaxID=416419 RepID=A0ZYM8_9CAUD|nr:hypothetical protein BJ1_gp15 [Halorubrum virus BJ1]CAL92437.1 hypothetical protein [Halorubrum virus BJ1]
MARTTAERIPETSYEAEKAAMDEVITDDLLEQEIDVEGPSGYQIKEFANTILREDLVLSIGGQVGVADFASILRNEQIATAFERHFTMDPTVSKAAFVTIYVGALFVANQGADPDQIELILRNVDTYKEAMAKILENIN